MATHALGEEKPLCARHIMGIVHQPLALASGLPSLGAKVGGSLSHWSHHSCLPLCQLLLSSNIHSSMPLQHPPPTSAAHTSSSSILPFQHSLTLASHSSILCCQTSYPQPRQQAGGLLVPFTHSPLPTPPWFCLPTESWKDSHIHPPSTNPLTPPLSARLGQELLSLLPSSSPSCTLEWIPKSSS